ncbi:MAG: tRNA (adenosine(37)-N6)-dimethylallyltransferase MiaA [Chitinophagaceae bacterium]|nr:tRNA (adenosine(37)-N6)-dimethylallyltransferase MiaA [Chitinophagaceae bacterium]
MNKNVILITGPTAVGKTALAVKLAKHFGTEIISADSRQCFAELNIGVAKPTAKELNEAPHHFINSHSIHKTVTAASFERYALQKAEDLFLTRNVIIMVGGTGLYIKAFCEGMDAIPPVNETTRNQLIALYKQNGINWLQQQLEIKDPLFAVKGEMQNPQRMLRALEVFETTGTSILELQTRQKKQRPFHVIKTGLELPREELYNCIHHRTEQMMRDGLLQEVKALIPFQHLNALQTVGYSELISYFNGGCTLEKAVEKIKQNTRHYAKRQLTWFKRDAGITWFHPLQTGELLAFVSARL